MGVVSLHMLQPINQGDANVLVLGYATAAALSAWRAPNVPAPAIRQLPTRRPVRAARWPVTPALVAIGGAPRYPR
jgi:hypothetical protein